MLDAVRLGPADDATARAALAFYLPPAFAVAFGALFLRESISASAVAGLAFIRHTAWARSPADAQLQRR